MTSFRRVGRGGRRKKFEGVLLRKLPGRAERGKEEEGGNTRESCGVGAAGNMGGTFVPEAEHINAVGKKVNADGKAAAETGEEKTKRRRVAPVPGVKPALPDHGVRSGSRPKEGLLSTSSLPIPGTLLAFRYNDRDPEWNVVIVPSQREIEEVREEELCAWKKKRVEMWRVGNLIRATSRSRREPTAILVSHPFPGAAIDMKIMCCVRIVVPVCRIAVCLFRPPPPPPTHSYTDRRAHMSHHKTYDDDDDNNNNYDDALSVWARRNRKAWMVWFEAALDQLKAV